MVRAARDAIIAELSAGPFNATRLKKLAGTTTRILYPKFILSPADTEGVKRVTIHQRDRKRRMNPIRSLTQLEYRILKLLAKKPRSLSQLSHRIAVAGVAEAIDRLVRLKLVGHGLNGHLYHILDLTMLVMVLTGSKRAARNVLRDADSRLVAE